MADIIDDPQSNAVLVPDTATDYDSPNSELFWSRLRILIELLLTNVSGSFGSGTLTSDPPNDTTGWATDTAASFADDEHNGRRLVFTDGNALCQDFTIDDTVAASDRVVCTGDNLYSAGARSGDAYIIVGDFRDTSADGHNHDNVNSPYVDGLESYTAGEYIIDHLAVEEGNTSQTQVAEFKMGRSGTIRTRVGLKNASAYQSHGRVKINGSTSQTTQRDLTSGSGWNYWNEDILVSKGDTVEFFAWIDVGGPTHYSSLSICVSNPTEVGRSYSYDGDGLIFEDQV